MFTAVMSLLVIMLIFEVLIFWIDYGKGIKRFVCRVIEYGKMKKAMKYLESKSYYHWDVARQQMMWFNKSFWGGIGYTYPRLYRDDYTMLYHIRFW